MEVARLKEQIRAARDVILLEKDVRLAPLPGAPGQPAKVDYCRMLGARYVPLADPVYVVGGPVQLHQQTAVALDQLRQRHLATLEALSLARVQTTTGCTGAPLGPPPRATIANLRAIIQRAAATVPYHDLLEYRLFGQLEDAQFTEVMDLVNDILDGAPMPQAHSADFVNLPKKMPHGPIANRKPLTNLATVWKLTAALLPALPCGGRHRAALPVWDVPPLFLRGAPPRPPRRVVGPLEGSSRISPRCGSSRPPYYQPRMVAGGIVPPYQFGMSPHCSSVELLRVLHDVWWDRLRRRLEAWVLSDDVRHAFGSINHTTEYGD